MNTITKTMMAAVSAMVLGATAQAADWDDRMENRSDLLTQPGITTRAVSGETLSGRREIVSENARIVRDGDDWEALIQDGDDLDTRRVNGFLGSEGHEMKFDDDGELEVDDD